jgi:hypothetical protein
MVSGIGGFKDDIDFATYNNTNLCFVCYGDRIDNLRAVNLAPNGLDLTEETRNELLHETHWMARIRHGERAQLG